VGDKKLSIPPPLIPKNLQFPQTAAEIMGCKSFFFGRENELQIHHGNFYLMDNKHRKLFVIDYSTLYVDDTSGESFLSLDLFSLTFKNTFLPSYGGGGDPPACDSATGPILAFSKNDTHLVLMAVVQSI